MIKKRLLVFLALFVVLISSLAFAHGEVDFANEESLGESGYLSGIDFAAPVTYIIITTFFLVIITVFILTIGKDFTNKNKKLFFWIMVIPIALSSLYLGGSTIYENIVSVTGGPIHWHADYQVHACGERLDLIDPQGLKNKIGNPIFHEHNDDRIHIEGTIEELSDVNLGKYFEVIGGELDDGVGHLIFNDKLQGVVSYESGDTCADGSIGSLKVYVNGNKVNDYSDYIIYPDTFVPPGDCIIVLFDNSDSETTELLCDTWDVNGWDYDTFVRPDVTIGGYSWQ